MSTPSGTATPLLPSDCPAVGTAHKAILQPAALTVSQHIIYYAERGGIQVAESNAKLMSYDVITGKANPLLSFANPETGIISAQLSSDGQWLLFVTDLWVQTPSSENNYILQKLQIIRADGQHLQTLMCNTNQAFQRNPPQLSPDNQHIAFNTFNPTKNSEVIDVLNLASGKIQEMDDSPNFYVRSWIDATRFYATPVSNRRENTSEGIYLFDMNFSTNSYTSGYPVSVGSLLSVCDTLEVDSTAKHLFTSSCAIVNKNCRAGIGLQGPSTLSMQPVAGGTPTSLYSDPSHAIITLKVVDPKTYLIYIQNSAGDTSQNGLWKVSAQGSHPTRLTKENTPMACYDSEGYASSLPEVFSNRQSYALRINGTLLLGSLNGGTPTTIYTKADTEDTLQLLGFATI